jgi:hypothetical protein
VVAVGEEAGVVVGCEDPPGCIMRRAIATTATIATATIIARFLFGPMGRGWLYGKNLFAMFNSGYIDVARHSLRQNSYECQFCVFAVVERSSGLGVLPRLPEKIAASLSFSSGSDELFKATSRRGEVAGVGVVDLLRRPLSYGRELI